MKKKQVEPVSNEDILEFLKQAQLVRECKYLQFEPKKKVRFKNTNTKLITTEAELPPREDIEVILMRIRPFIEYNERLHVGRVITYLLDKYGDSEFLKNFQLLFQPQSEKSYPAIVVKNKEYRMRELLISYMYGKYLHLDKEKQKINALFEQAFGELAEFFALSQIDKYTGIILGVAGYIRKNKLYEANDSNLETKFRNE